MKDVAVYTMGRFNPMTSGHEKLINKVKSVAKKEGGDAFVFPTVSHDSKKNPLKFEQKVAFLKKLFPSVKFNTDKKYDNPFAVLYALEDYDHLIFIVGGDRVDEFSKKIEKYFVKTFQSKNPNRTIEIRSAGARSAVRVGNEDVSGTFMRKYAKANDFETFSKGLPKVMKKTDAKKLFNAVRAGMGLSKYISEDYDNYD